MIIAKVWECIAKNQAIYTLNDSPNKIWENRIRLGNPYYLVQFENRTKTGTVLSETVLSGDSLYKIEYPDEKKNGFTKKITLN